MPRCSSPKVAPSPPRHHPVPTLLRTLRQQLVLGRNVSQQQNLPVISTCWGLGREPCFPSFLAQLSQEAARAGSPQHPSKRGAGQGHRPRVCCTLFSLCSAPCSPSRVEAGGKGKKRVHLSSAGHWGCTSKPALQWVTGDTGVEAPRPLLARGLGAELESGGSFCLAAVLPTPIPNTSQLQRLLMSEKK